MLVKYTENYEDTQSGHELCTLNKLNKTKKNKNKKEKVKKESEYDILIAKYIQSENVKSAIYDFIKMRVTIKKTINDKSFRTFN